jgi:hypothetical protein
MTTERRRRRCCAGRTARLLRVVDAPLPPVVPIGWRFTPLRCQPDTRWLAWDDRHLRVTIVVEVAPPELCTALWRCGYELVVSSATFEVWAAARP